MQIKKIKQTIYKLPLVAKIINIWRSRIQEKDYINIRENSWNKKYVPSKENLIKPQRQYVRKEDIRIFVIVGHDWEHRSIVPNLEKAFNVVTFDYGDYVANRYDKKNLKWRKKLQDDVIAVFNESQKHSTFDLVFAYGSYNLFEPKTFQHFRTFNVPIALLWLDDKHAFLSRPSLPYLNGQTPLIGSVDVHLTNSMECINWYKSYGVKAYYFPEGCNPDNSFTVDVNTQKEYDVSFIGRNYGTRNQFINHLIKAGIKIDCFGFGWPNGSIADYEIPKVIQKSWISLGFGGVAYSDRITCLKGRDFEVPALGCAYLTSFDYELANMFQIGKEILCYRNELDAIEQIRFYLDNRDELCILGKSARERCIREHTWALRMEGLLKWMGILQP